MNAYYLYRMHRSNGRVGTHLAQFFILEQKGLKEMQQRFISLQAMKQRLLQIFITRIFD